MVTNRRQTRWQTHILGKLADSSPYSHRLPTSHRFSSSFLNMNYDDYFNTTTTDYSYDHLLPAAASIDADETATLLPSSPFTESTYTILQSLTIPADGISCCLPRPLSTMNDNSSMTQQAEKEFSYVCESNANYSLQSYNARLSERLKKKLCFNQLL